MLPEPSRETESVSPWAMSSSMALLASGSMTVASMAGYQSPTSKLNVAPVRLMERPCIQSKNVLWFANALRSGRGDFLCERFGVPADRFHDAYVGDSLLG